MVGAGGHGGWRGREVGLPGLGRNRMTPGTAGPEGLFCEMGTCIEGMPGPLELEPPEGRTKALLPLWFPSPKYRALSAIAAQ